MVSGKDIGVLQVVMPVGALSDTTTGVTSTYTLSDVIVTEYEVDAGSSTNPTATVSFGYEKIQVAN